MTLGGGGEGPGAGSSSAGTVDVCVVYVGGQIDE